MRGRIVDISLGMNRKQRITLELDQDFRPEYERLKDQELDVEIKKHRAKRSRNANSYMWVLLDKMADTLGSSKDELYLGYVRQYGVYKDFMLTPEEAKTFKVAWSMLGTGWPTEQVDYAADGNHVLVRAYYGTSRYNTKRMSRLIDAIVQDCKELGIETDTPEEIEKYKSYWRSNDER